MAFGRSRGAAEARVVTKRGLGYDVRRRSGPRQLRATAYLCLRFGSLLFWPLARRETQPSRCNAAGDVRHDHDRVLGDQGVTTRGGLDMAVGTAGQAELRTAETSIPARMDRLPWS